MAGRMSYIWILLLCSLAGSGLCLVDQPSKVQVENNQEHPILRSRKYCDPTNNNHTGGAIEDCGPGQYRARRGPYRGQCVPCNCNGFSHECDQNTGKCLNCQLNTAGDHCEHCAEGHYGIAALRTCRLCPCPFSQPSHSFAIGCLEVGGHVECLCKAGYSGTHCERCAIGYYGDPLAGRSCQLCDCNHGYICDPITGKCESPDEPSTDNDCQECDSCFQTLMDALEAMDDELAILKAQLKFQRNISISLTALRILEDDIIATKELVKNYRESVRVLKHGVSELEADMDGVRKDVMKLKIKADQTSLTSKDLLRDLNKTHQKGQNLLTDTEELLKRIQEFLEQLRISNGIDSTLSGKLLSGILEEAQRMVEQMRKQNCKVQRKLAENELWEAQKLLDYIKNNLTSPLDSAQATAERIAQDLMSWNTGLKELEEALKQAAKAVNKTILMNVGNEEVLSDIMNHHLMFENKQDDIWSDLAMIRGTLRDTEDLQNMMNNLKNVYAKLAAELDGAKSQLNQRLVELSKATAMDVIVRKAEEHAQELMDLAMHFQMSLLSFTNTSVVHKAIDVITAFEDIINAIKEAEAAANKANKAADHALADVKAQDLTKKAEELKNSANSLDDKAKEAENNLKEAAEKYDTIKERLDKAKGKKRDMQKEIQTLEDELNVINRDHIGALLKQAKDAVQAANKTVNNDTARLRNISEELDKIKIPSGESNVDNILNSVNKTLDELNKFFPNLTDTLAEVENQSSRLPSSANMSASIMRIKDMIERTRELANTIRGPILLSGESHIELRPPKNLVDLQAFTAMDLMLRRPKKDGEGRRSRRQSGEEENLFVLYLGNKNMKRDFIGMVVMDGVLYCVYKLGDMTYKIKTEKITRSSIDSSFMDRVDFRRIYQDAEVIYTQHYSSSVPKKLSKITNQPNTTVNLLDLGSDEVVFYVGGYPDDFTPPLELQYPKFKGCIEFITLNAHILSLYNFQHAVNIKNTDQCLRGETREVTKYFDGTGYGKISVISSRSVRFFVLSRQENALLLFMGNEDSHFTITIERGYVVLRHTENGQKQIKRSDKKVFPVAYFRNIKILHSLDKTEIIVVDYSVNIVINYNIYNQAFIGGIPAALTERLNINHPALRGCLKGLEVDVAIKFSEAIGIHAGCPQALLGVHEVTLETGSSLALTANSTLPNSATMVSLGFRSTQSTGVLLHTRDADSGFELSLVDGHVEMKDSTTNLKSKNRYDEGRWHYVTAYRNSTGMELNVDNFDRGDVQTMSTGSIVQNTDVILGKETFKGCMRNFYMRRIENRCIPIDLSNFTQTGNVSFGSCNTQQQPLSIMARSSLRRKGHVKSNIRKKDCSQPVGHILAYHLSARSQLQYILSPEDLNYRPHIFLDIRTRSADGLLLHITDKQGFARVILFMSGGRVKLFVGDGTLIYYQKKINNGAWHNIRFSVEQHVTHLVVDGFRVPDGQLQKDEGISMELQPPVYFGAGKIQPITDTQGIRFPQKSVIGCIRNVRFNNVLIGEPAVNHGGAPCFDGVVEEGAYFAGGGSHIILEKHFRLGAEFDLTFEVRPRNMTGLLFHCRGHQDHSLSVFLKKGTMVVQMNDGAGDYSTSLTPPLPLCAESFHRVTVTKKGNVIQLKMGHKSTSAVGPHVHSPSKTRHTLYIGGVPETKRKRVPVWSSYLGCLRNVQINQAALSFKSVSSVFGSVNVNECPAE
ncbi:laminin subunit alpha-3 [Pangasianodon hypophthalmus]|uniref:laminin subunit alpha-3 n=1 Tax=Pangasianodon hypophthalmus TaxID=310915 RepID=UPI00230701F4|nr:laminin subunit alpha-3 [Pangasianodon hypophthalmus]